ncbi:MAG: hypothetical protein IJR07_05885 [Bacteroidaceae bacterium]|nr:hypothetical protein [Bacteroidaceae bacterium]
MNKYRHTYTSTASDITPLYRLMPNAMLMTASHKKVRFPKMQSSDMQVEHRVTRLDLDFNFHVSNRSYVSIALLTMPDEVLASQTLSSITVHWLHETYLDETLLCSMSRTDDGCYLHTLTNARCE